MWIKLVVLASLICCGAPSLASAAQRTAHGNVCAAQTDFDRTLRRDIDPIVQAAAARGFAGQVAIAHNGVLVYRRSEGTADLAGAVPVTNETLFHVASVTKYFTAFAVLKAIEEGRLHFSDRIAPLLDNAAISTPDATVEDLLAHRAGLGSTYAAEAATDQKEAIAAIAGQAFDPARAHAFRYSNDGYDLLGVILERVYGAPYENILRRQLRAASCDMALGFWGEIDRNDPHVRSQALEVAPEQLQRRNYGMIGSGGLLTTAFALVGFERALNAGNLLGPALMTALRTPRGDTDVGQALFGSFLITTDALGPAISARGQEDWGDNVYLNDYRNCGFIVAVVTSRGPAEATGAPLFRDRLTAAIEQKLASRCRR